MYIYLEIDVTTQQRAEMTRAAVVFGVAPHRNMAQQAQHGLTGQIRNLTPMDDALLPATVEMPGRA